MPLPVPRSGASRLGLGPELVDPRGRLRPLAAGDLRRILHDAGVESSSAGELAALAALSGLKLLVIDDAEILDDENRALLTNFLFGKLDEFDTVILLSTSPRERVVDPGVDGVSVYWVEAGEVERIGEKVGVS